MTTMMNEFSRLKSEIAEKEYQIAKYKSFSALLAAAINMSDKELCEFKKTPECKKIVEMLSNE